MTYPERSGAAAEGMAKVAAVGAGPGAEAKVLVRDAGGFSLLHLWLKPNYTLPRHTHDVDCMYYVISGVAHLGNQALRPGDSFFVPAHAPYGYTAGPDGVEVLEVRHGVDTFGIELVDVAASRWEAMAAAAAANREVWAEAKVSPTFAANAG